MYQTLSDNETKFRYKEILNETIAIVTRLKDKHDAQYPLWGNILNQLADIKENIVDKESNFDWDDINRRYSLGIIAVRFFDKEDEMQERLFDIFSGAIHYSSYPEK